MTARFHPLAARELTDAAVFYEGQAPGLGGFGVSLTQSYIRSLAADLLCSRSPINDGSRGTGLAESHKRAA